MKAKSYTDLWVQENAFRIQVKLLMYYIEQWLIVFQLMQPWYGNYSSEEPNGKS